MKKGFIVLLMIALAGIALGCDFKLEAESTQVNTGDTFYVRVTVIKDHNKCTLTSMDDYKFDAEKLELLGITEWQEISSNTFQTWIKVQAIDAGEGLLKIWKNCSKEGYDEEVLPFEIS
ncbi:MAG: hypothetical protein U9N62_05430 [Thermotogota bacterium]|nr:hypothetical protein [Thermotogota bacterium]